MPSHGSGIAMTGQSLQGLNISGLNNQNAHAQGLQGVQTNSQKLRLQQQLNQQATGKKDGAASEYRGDEKSAAGDQVPPSGAEKGRSASVPGQNEKSGTAPEPGSAGTAGGASNANP